MNQILYYRRNTNILIDKELGKVFLEKKTHPVCSPEVFYISFWLVDIGI
jgi:hypothetical protein